MYSNTKLTAEQKAALKHMRKEMPWGSTLAMSVCGFTVVAVFDGSITRISTSIASDQETKIRPKVGEYYALSRYWDSFESMLPGDCTAAEYLEALSFEVAYVKAY